MVHNSSPQTGVVPSTDPALDTTHEHTHAHLHHGASALKHRTPEEDVVYSSGTTNERSTIPHQSKLDDIDHRRQTGNAKAQNEMEKGDIGYNVNKSELGYEVENTSSSEEEDPKHHGLSGFYKRHRIIFHAALAIVITGWWIASLVLHVHNMNWVIPFLFWLAIMLRILFWWVPVSYVSRSIRWTWRNSGGRVAEAVPKKLGLPLGTALVVAVILAGTFGSAEVGDNTRASRAVSCFGLLVITFGFWLTSRNRKAIIWHTILVGYLMQFIIALFVLRTGVGQDIFRFISDRATNLLGSANAGTEFLLSAAIVDMHYFATGVLPPIIFFVAIVQVLYYWGFIQWSVGKVAKFFFWALRVSGAEAVVASATPFIGQGESAMLIKPFVPHLTKAEIHQVMACGFATISGSVLVAYIGLGVNPQALISSCVMSIPASLAFSKLRYPETEETLTSGRVVVPDDEDHQAANVIHAFANGAWLGLKIAGMIAATLLCIIALVSLINLFLTWWGRYLNLTGDYDLTLELILGYVFFPIAWLLGVSGKHDILRVARLIGIKVIQNEFVAFSSLTSDPDYASLSDRSRLIATYAVCGFGNLGSLGTQIGVLSQISPARSGDVSRVALSALATGIFATLSSASVAGMVVQNQKTLFSVAKTAPENVPTILVNGTIVLANGTSLIITGNANVTNGTSS